MRFLSITTIALLSVSLLGCAVSPAMNETKIVQNIEYRLGTGDKLRLTVFGHEKLSGEFNVGSNGNISFPLILDTKVSGLTTSELEASITQKLTPDYLLDPKVSIEVLNYRNIYILGEVRTPGEYPFIPNMTVKQVVAIAGGYTYRANENTAEITRLSQGAITTKTVDTLSIISPGDTLTITRKWF